MKKLALTVAAGIVGAFTLTAATPVAVWDGDFTTLTKGTFTLSENGNTKTDSYLQISGDNGITVTSTGALNVFTVIMRCSGLNLAAENAQVLFTSYVSDSQANLTGYYLLSGNSNTKGIWDGADWSSESGATKNPVPANYTTLIYNHQQTNGTYGYALGPTSGEDETVVRTTLYSVVGLRSSGSTYKGFSIGGLRGTTSTTLLPATGLKITSIAVFSGTLTEAEMKGYYFPSEIQPITVSSDTNVSAINAQFDSANYKTATVTVDSGVTISVDTAFVAPFPVTITSSGSITLSASSQPDASYFSAVSFAVEGALLRSWLTPGVVGFNFNANGGRNGQGNTDGAANTALALEIGTWYKDAYSPSGSSTAMFSDGLSQLTWQANNVYAEAGSLTAGTFIQGYLDDGNNVGITLSNVPYATYDVIIYCSTDDSSKSFKAKTVNGTIYTWDATAGATVTTDNANATWGLASAAAGKAVYGANTIRVNNLSGPLTIAGGTSGNNARGCISAIQIMPAGTSTAPEMTVGTAGQTTQATWTGANWNVATAPTSGNVIINLSGDVELTVDETVALSAITVIGEGKLKIIPDQPNNVTFTASSISSAVPLIFANNGIGIDTISASVTYLYKTPSINSSTYGNTYTAGVGSQESSVAVNHNGGSVVLDGTAGETYWLSQSNSGTSTAVTFTNATVNYSNGLSVGMANYTVGGASVITTTPNSDNNHSFYLSDGQASRTASFILKDTSVVNVSGTSDVDSNQASILFGHWNGPSTFTIQDEAAFNAVAQVLVGKTSNNHTININGGTFTARGIKASASASGANRLNLNGGLLVLGDVGITSYGSTTIGVNVSANSEIRASAATLPISQAMTLGANTTLAFTKANDVSATTVSLTGAVSGSGDISVGPGVTLNLGTNRPEGEISIDATTSLEVVMASKADLPVLKVSSNPASVVLYDTDGTTVLSGANVIYDAEAGTITVHPPVNTWNVASDLNFDTAGNWSYGIPESTQDTAIKVTGDAALTIAGTYEAATLTVSGSGVVEFSGAGSFTVGTLYLNGGATLAPNSKISATSIVLESGTVLRLKDKTESSVISGAGAVETYGNVVFGGSNQFTGGLTVKAGSAASTTAQQGFGKNNYGQAIANLSRIVVEDGGSLDLANTKDACYAITIAGKGLESNGVYSGAVFNSGEAMGSGNRQTASLTLTADAMVKVESGHGWGIVNSSHAASVLALGGRTLTVSGSGTFPIVNANTASGTATTGMLVMDGVNLQLTSTACNFSGVNVVVKGCASVDLETAPSALGSLRLKPSTSGTSATHWNLPSGFVPAVDTSNIDAANLAVGQVLTLFTAPSATTLTTETIAVKAGGRYTTTISGNTVTATVGDALLFNPFLHYDFENGAAIDTGKAPDSRTYISGFGENSDPLFVNGCKGKAVRIRTPGYTPYWDTNNLGVSPFAVGEVTVTTVARMKETGVILWGLGNTNNSNPAMGLIAVNSTTAAVVARRTSGTVETNLMLQVTSDLTKGWHFFAVVANANGTTLYVDRLSTTTDKTVSFAIGQMGQFGSFHGGAIGASKVGSDGYYLDDWRVYDAALTAKEIRLLKIELQPDPFRIQLR